MKIIKKEQSFGVFPMTIVCKEVKDQYGFSYGNKVDFCGSQLEIVAEDIIAHDWSKYPDYKGTDYGVICPVCGQFILVDEKLIPKLVKESAEKVQLK